MRTMNNGKSMALALVDFATEYGSYPDRDTAAAVKENTHTTLDLDGDTANDYFRQLIAAGIVKSEDIFFSRSPYSPRKPDNNCKDGEALKPGEVGFGYLMNGNKSLPADDPDRIIAVTPLLNATATGEFDPEPLQGKAALVDLDMSVKLVPIRDDNRRVELAHGIDLLDSGPGTIWGTGITPVIKPPQPPPGWRPSIWPGTSAGLAWLLVGGTAVSLLALWLGLKRRGTAQ